VQLPDNAGGITVAMLRAFVCLSRHLNLSKACDELGATRQTVRRHITELEAIKGDKLFEVEERRYRLTPFGRGSLAGARSILQQIDAWSGQSALTRQLSGGLESSRYTDADGRAFYSQQHPVSKIALNGLPLVRKALVAWGNAETQIEHEAMEIIRPYAVLYRKGPAGWVFVDVGPESAYARWFGWAWSKSAIGKLMNEDNVGDEFNEFISGAYLAHLQRGGRAARSPLRLLSQGWRRTDAGDIPAPVARLRVSGWYAGPARACGDHEAGRDRRAKRANIPDLPAGTDHGFGARPSKSQHRRMRRA
jgi:hypothetical protein